MKKTSLILALFCLGWSFVTGQQWVPVWSDEFNTPGLPDTSRWTYEKGMIRNNEAQYYTEKRIENAHIDDTVLVIEARRENYLSASYTSASLQSRFTGDWLYGKIEVRAKIPTGKGSWPAIWMMPSDNEYGGWPRSGEIDIMENVGYEPNHIYTTVHYFGTDGSGHQSNGTHVVRTEPYNKYYTYTVQWYPDKIEWYIDGSKIHTYNKPVGADFRLWPFDKRFYLILNLAIGGTWGGVQGIDNALFPLKYYIDFVRVYKWQEDSGPYGITIQPSTGGNVEVDPVKETYTAGDTVSVSAYPHDGYYFAGFLYLGNANPLTLVVNDHQTIIPLFFKTGELIQNGSFERGLFGWNNVYTFDPDNGSGFPSVESGVYVFEVTNPASDWWQIGDQWLGLSAQSGKTYKLEFDAWADSPNDLGISFAQNYGAYSTHYENTALSIGSVKTPYTWSFLFNKPTDNNCRLYFGFGRFTGKVYLDNVSFTAVNLTPVADNRLSSSPGLEIGYHSADRSFHFAWQQKYNEHVRLSLCDLHGRTLAMIYDEPVPTGFSKFTWQMDQAYPSPGVYLIRYESPSFNQAERIIVF